MIARGEVSSSEAVEAHIARIERVNPALNAVVVKRYDAARAEAREADQRVASRAALAPLHGVPLTIKECLDLEGTPSTFGLPFACDDPGHARRPVGGPTRTPGGSSGGQGAIIAAGGSPMGIGTDIGGSVRVPAAFCGIASIKPTAGRVPDPGRLSVPFGQRAVVSQIGVLARSVAHAHDIFLAILAADGGRGMREILGHDRRDPRIARLALVAGRSRTTLAVLRALLRLLGQRSSAEPLRNFGHSDTLHYWKLVEEHIKYQQRFRRAMDEADGGPLDVLLCPAHALPALTHGSTQELMTAGGYDTLYNVLGYPAGVVPLTRVRPDEEVGREKSRDLVEAKALEVEQGSAGLPVGVQVVGRPWREHVVLAAMRVLEEATAGRADRPGIVEPAAAEPRSS